MKKLLKGIFALVMCVTIVGSCVPVSAASRSNAYMTTSIESRRLSINVKNDFTVESMYARMVYVWLNHLDGKSYTHTVDKTTKRTKSCNLIETGGLGQLFLSCGYTGKIEGSVVGDWILHR